MTAKACGCSQETCGCCEGTRKLTPASTVNRPGLDALLYRVGTHGMFFETMKARLSTITVEAPGPDGQTVETFQPLRGLTIRSASDPAIALLDGWATVGDVLTFYQERIANEGYLRTATERRSVLELARLVGYTLRPGVAATAFLAYTLEDRQTEPVEIPAGARSQSVPGPGESPQSFETSEKLIARAEWNNLQVRLQRPQKVTHDNALTVDALYVAGTNLNLKAGDKLLLLFGEGGDQATVRTVGTAEAQFEKGWTRIELEPLPVSIAAALPALKKLIADLRKLSAPPEGVLHAAELILKAVYLGMNPETELWVRLLVRKDDSGQSHVITDFAAEVNNILNDLPAGQNGRESTDPSKFVADLLKPRIPQAANSLRLGRSLKSAFADTADLQPQLLVNFMPELKDTLYVAWANAQVNAASPALKGVYAFRLAAPLFGATAAKLPTYFATDDPQGNPPHFRSQLQPPSNWQDWDLEGDESTKALFLDQSHEEILAGGYVLIDTPEYDGSDSLIMRQVQAVTSAQTAPRTAYGISATTTRLAFANDWWEEDESKGVDEIMPPMTMPTLRRTLVYGQSEQLTLVDEQLTADVGGAEIQLDGLYNGLESGRWVIFSGERADIPGVAGVTASELLMISGLRQDFDASLPGDTTHTTLLLATPAAYSYKRDKLTIYGNVVKATHGETRNETLGSGDGSRPLQSFELQQPPLTFVPAPNQSGVESTLEIYVNDVEWHEADTLAGLKPKDRRFITKTDDDDKTTVTFGNGQEGARLPTGVLNVKAVYRNGIGRGGNVQAGQISLLQTRPLGVKGVTNPLRASGGADKETRDQARENAPLAVMALDRLVSLRDYADFARTFAGIAKASGRRLSDGRREFVHLTVAGADDIPIDPTSDLYRNLLTALRSLGDSSTALQVDPRQLVVLVLGANVGLLPDYQWEPVMTEVRAELLRRFGFRSRALGQPALLCEVVAAIQNVEGVAYVDVDTFGGIPESTDLRDLSEAAGRVVANDRGGAPVPAQVVPADLASFVGGALRPAQLAIFTPAVQDTIVLNQIK